MILALWLFVLGTQTSPPEDSEVFVAVMEYYAAKDLAPGVAFDPHPYRVTHGPRLPDESLYESSELIEERTQIIEGLGLKVRSAFPLRHGDCPNYLAVRRGESTRDCPEDVVVDVLISLPERSGEEWVVRAMDLIASKEGGRMAMGYDLFLAQRGGRWVVVRNVTRTYYE